MSSLPREAHGAERITGVETNPGSTGDESPENDVPEFSRNQVKAIIDMTRDQTRKSCDELLELRSQKCEQIIREQHLEIERLQSEIAKLLEAEKTKLKSEMNTMPEADTPKMCEEAIPRNLLESEESVLLPRSNEKILPGTHVRIKGLQKHSELNGEMAKVINFDCASGRYKCELLNAISSGNRFGCKLENLDVHGSAA